MMKRKSRPQMLAKAAAKAVVGKKIPRWKHRAGSIPALGTKIKMEADLLPFFLSEILAV